ncbi:damage-inducible protein DinB [Veronia nyctiphanis]|uniref:Damage-inducible protein DinB n=1 Tax=Veronia nyctiphanis TaxID=1278244 RepID=A0A4Q0YP02_9GAMM|nr:DinB family protein [Veronia nyctiphanis]RXJ72223.1 damage-inducible protein DinB [Veronia nyctiphanis]
MDISANFRMLAVYNQRMNKQLLEVCQQLTNEQLQQNTNAFFPSVMAHWNHILFGDLIMLQRLIAGRLVDVEPSIIERLPIAKAVDDQFVADLKELSILRPLVDSIYVDITRSLKVTDCNNLVRYTTTEGKKIERNLAEFLQHIFNHQTHHRGQLTCVLSQLGMDFGCTDLPIIVPEGAR